VLEVVARHWLSAWHARPLQQFAGVLTDFGPGHNDLDGHDLIGAERPLHTSDQGQARAGAVQEVLARDPVVEPLDQPPVAQRKPQA